MVGWYGRAEVQRVRIHTRTYAHMNVWIHERMDTRTYGHTYVWTHIRMHTRAYGHTYVWTHVSTMWSSPVKDLRCEEDVQGPWRGVR